MLMSRLSKLSVFKTLRTESINFLLRTRSIFIANYKKSDHKLPVLEKISFEDVRLQKHLKALNDNLLNFQEVTNSKETMNSFNYETLHNVYSLVQHIEVAKTEIQELDLLISELKENNDELLTTALLEKQAVKNKLDELKNSVLNFLIPEEIVDDKDIIMELSQGVGGQEAMLFTKDMFEMYCNYARWKGWGCEILKYDTTDLGGIRNAHISINGANAFKILKFESGVHRVQRVPKTEKAGRIHTSTMTVAVLPQPSEIDIVINPRDIEMEFKRSSGAGGQHVNTTDSCVRITHKPTGIVAESQMERDQHKNRKLALQSLRAKLYERELQSISKETNLSRRLQVGTAARSEKVRTYNFAQDRITDHRAHITVHDVESIFQGEEHLDELLHMLQKWNGIQSLMEILNKYNSD